MQWSGGLDCVLESERVERGGGEGRHCVHTKSITLIANIENTTSNI
jgi:hypothetical protein